MLCGFGLLVLSDIMSDEPGDNTGDLPTVFLHLGFAIQEASLGFVAGLIRLYAAVGGLSLLTDNCAEV